MVALGLALVVSACGGKASEEQPGEGQAGGQSSLNGDAVASGGAANEASPEAEICDDRLPTIIELDVSDCAARSIDTCAHDSSQLSEPLSSEFRLDSTFRKLIETCAHAEEFSVTLELDEHGCATRFTTNYPFSDEGLGCVRARLASVRYQCGEPISCVRVQQYWL